MKNIKSENIEKIAFFLTAIISSLTIQLLAQSLYPTFEERVVESNIERSASSLAIR